MSIQAYILIQTEVGKAGSVTKAIGGIAGVTIAESICYWTLRRNHAR
ncbi:MAG: hypothetical protein RLZZ92_356 [Actinomycetota bacterium]